MPKPMTLPRWLSVARTAVAYGVLVGACSGEDSDKTAPEVGQQDGSALSGKDQTVCEARDEEASRWVESYLDCDSDLDCEITEISAECLSAFLCPIALSTKIDRAAFDLEAKRRQVAYAAECPCSQADCDRSSSFEAFCEPSTKHCAHRSKPASN